MPSSTCRSRAASTNSGSASSKLATHDQAIAGILDAIRQLMQAPASSKRSIGFVVPEERKKR